ncbi:hypothetical protein PG995_007627 [Apiospora arundinis]
MGKIVLQTEAKLGSVEGAGVQGRVHLQNAGAGAKLECIGVTEAAASILCIWLIIPTTASTLEVAVLLSWTGRTAGPWRLRTRTFEVCAVFRKFQIARGIVIGFQGGIRRLRILCVLPAIHSVSRSRVRNVGVDQNSQLLGVRWLDGGSRASSDKKCHGRHRLQLGRCFAPP